MTRQIGFFGGSFDPPHLGHINLALALMEVHDLEEVLFSPAWVSPFKNGHPSTSPDHRLKMTALSIENVPKLRLYDQECQHEDVSYTIDTLRILKKNESRTIRLILGTDTAQDFPSWREPDEIVRLAPPLIGCRPGTPKICPVEASPFVQEALINGQTTIPIMDISSSQIRQRLKIGLYCGHLLPAKVLDYIYYHHLYFTLLDGPS